MLIDFPAIIDVGKIQKYISTNKVSDDIVLFLYKNKITNGNMNIVNVEMQKYDILNGKMDFINSESFMSYEFIYECMKKNVINKETFKTFDFDKFYFENFELESDPEIKTICRDGFMKNIYLMALVNYQDIKVLSEKYIIEHFNDIITILKATHVFEKTTCSNNESNQIKHYKSKYPNEPVNMYGKNFCYKTDIHICPKSEIYDSHLSCINYDIAKNCNVYQNNNGRYLSKITIKHFAILLSDGNIVKKLTNDEMHVLTNSIPNKIKYVEDNYRLRDRENSFDNYDRERVEDMRYRLFHEIDGYKKLLKIYTSNIYDFDYNESNIYSILMNIIVSELIYQHKIIVSGLIYQHKIPDKIKNNPIYIKYIFDNKQKNNGYISDENACIFIKENMEHIKKIYNFVKNDKLIFSHFTLDELPDDFYFNRCQTDRKYINFLIEKKFNRLEIFHNNLELLSEIQHNCYVYDITIEKGQKIFTHLVDKNKYSTTYETIKFISNSKDKFGILFKKLYEQASRHAKTNDLYKFIEKLNDDNVTEYLITNNYFNDFMCYDINTNFGEKFIKQCIMLKKIKRTNDTIKFIEKSDENVVLYRLCFDNKILEKCDVDQKYVICEHSILQQATLPPSCLICYESIVKKYIMVPCGHLGVCSKCFTQMKEKSNQMQCPICRKEVLMHIEVFE
jgi:hypothetical protein